MSLLTRNRILLLVSDMAGTTINEGGIIYNSIHNTLKKIGYPAASNEEIKSWYGKDKREVIKNHINKYTYPPKNINNLCDEAEKILLEDLDIQYFGTQKAKLIDPELPKLFLNLRCNGVKIGLNTGYPSKFQEKIINHFEMDRYIDAYISSEEVALGRPYPYMIYSLMEQCKILNIQNVAKIGDTANDMMEGKNAGCGLTIGVLTGASTEEELTKYGADIVLENITDINNTNIWDDRDEPPFLL